MLCRNSNHLRSVTMRIDKYLRGRKDSLRTLPFRITMMDGRVLANAKSVDPEEFKQRYSEQIQQAKEENIIIGVNFQPE